MGRCLLVKILVVCSPSFYLLRILQFYNFYGTLVCFISQKYEKYSGSAGFPTSDGVEFGIIIWSSDSCACVSVAWFSDASVSCERTKLKRLKIRLGVSVEVPTPVSIFARWQHSLRLRFLQIKDFLLTFSCNYTPQFSRNYSFHTKPMMPLWNIFKIFSVTKFIQKKTTNTISFQYILS